MADNMQDAVTGMVGAAAAVPGVVIDVAIGFIDRAAETAITAVEGGEHVAHTAAAGALDTVDTAADSATANIRRLKNELIAELRKVQAAALEPKG